MPRREVVPVKRGGGDVSRSNLPNEPAVPTSEGAEGALTGGTLPARAGLVNLILLDRLQRVEAALGVSRGGGDVALGVVDGALGGLETLFQQALDDLSGRKERSLQLPYAAGIYTRALNEVRNARQTVAQAAEQARSPEAEART